MMKYRKIGLLWLIAVAVFSLGSVNTDSKPIKIAGDPIHTNLVLKPDGDPIHT